MNHSTWKHRSTKLRLVLALVLSTSLSGSHLLADDSPIAVFTSLVPHAEFVAEIGGPHVSVSVLVGPGHAPANYQPTPRQMARLAEARLFVAAAVPFEVGLLPKIQRGNPDLIVLGGAPLGAVLSDANPHAWLDPHHVRDLADLICQELTAMAPAHAKDFAARRDGFQQRLMLLDEEIAQKMAPYQGQEFFVFHPAYGHFAARYGLVQVAVENEGHEPGAQQLVKIIEQAKAAHAKVIIVQPQFSRRSAEAVATSCDAEVLVLDPLAADYERNLRHIAEALASAWDSES